MRTGAPIEAEARSKALVVRICQAVRNGFVAGKYESNRSDSGGVAAGFASLWELNGKGAAGRESAGINRRTLSWPESLHLVANIGHRRVQFPAHTVVQCQIRPDLPTVLSEEINRGAPDQFMLRRTLCQIVRQPKEIIGVRRGISQIVPGHRRAIGSQIGICRTTNVRIAVEDDLPVNVEVQQLIELLITCIAAKLETVILDDFAEVVADLKRIADLRQLATEVIADGESAIELNVGHSFLAGPEPRVKTEVSIAGAGRWSACRRRPRRKAVPVGVHQWRIALASETECFDRSRAAGSLNGICPRGSVKLELALPEVAEPEFVDSCRPNRGRVGYVDLLRACCIVAREVAQRRSLRLKFCEGVQRVVIVKVIINRQFLIVVEGVIDLYLELIAAVSL